jgi:hypothetical protein
MEGKNMKNVKKILIVIMIALICVAFLNMNISLADDSWKNLDQFGAGDTGLNTAAQDIVGAIISVVRIVAVGVAIIMLTFVAIKYMSSAPGDRAEIKKHAVVYVVGAVVLFGTSGILTIIQNFANNI